MRWVVPPAAEASLHLEVVLSVRLAVLWHQEELLGASRGLGVQPPVRLVVRLEVLLEVHAVARLQQLLTQQNRHELR